MIALRFSGTDPEASASELERLWGQGVLVALAAPQDRSALEAALPAHPPDPCPWGPGVVIGSGGSVGQRRWIVQPLGHLERAAEATGHWLRQQGMDPASAVLFNPLPLHHVSGLMPLVRSRCWGAPLRWLDPALMREPTELLRRVPVDSDAPGDGGAMAPALLSLVPTQLARLLAEPAGVAWLRGFAVVWIGGAALPQELAVAARCEGLRLSPCYGSSETGGMVAALSPDRFLAGEPGCGPALDHAELGIDPASGALQVRAASLAAGCFAAGAFHPLGAPGGWWTSGDGGRLSDAGLEILGRLDGAISSGGETVFPEEVERRLGRLARERGLALDQLLVLGQSDPVWGERLVALVRALPGVSLEAVIGGLEKAAAELPPAQRPRSWRSCPDLAPTALGKWERRRWRDWLALQAPDEGSINNGSITEP